MTDITQPILFKFKHDANDFTFTKDGEAYTSPAGWFKNLQPNHENRGLRYVFPFKHPEYSEEIEKILTNLEKGDTIRVTCISLNKRNTKWRIKEIKETNC